MMFQRQPTSFSPLRRLFIFFVILLLTNECSSYRFSTRIIKTNYGELRGVKVKPNHRALGEVEMFLGVPYATPPVGNWRFMPPRSPLPWGGIKRHNYLAPVCPQKLPDVSNKRESLKRMPQGRYDYLQRLIPQLRNQSEDCLYLNIYAPVRDHYDSTTEKLSVIVFIHGESYEWNSGNPYDGTVLASYGQVIVITVNFRLGILGFLRPALKEKHVSNFGLLDQIAALHWIKGNIKAFGGNPDSVTIFGHGTGAALVNLLLISPVAHASKLFKRAILMSGSALSKWAFTWDPYKFTIQVAKALKCPLIDSNESNQYSLFNCLRDKTVEQLLAVPLQTPSFTTPLGPIMDNTLIKKDRNRMLSIDRIGLSQYDLLYGVTSAESFNILNASEVKFGMSKERRNRLLRAYISHTFDHQTSQIYQAVLNEYITVYDPTSRQYPGKREDMEIRDRVVQMLSDSQIVAPVVSMGNIHSKNNRKSYFYVFNHQSQYGYYPTNQGTVHAQELAYIFGAPLTGGFNHFHLKYTLEEQFLSELVMILWTNFAKTGNPNMPTPNGYKTENAPFNWMDNLQRMWPAYDSMRQEYLLIDMQVVKKSYYRAKKLAVWNTLIPEILSSAVEMKGPIDQPLKKINLVPTFMPGYPSNVNPFDSQDWNRYGKPVTIPPAPPRSPSFSEYPKSLPKWSNPSVHDSEPLSEKESPAVSAGTSMSLMVVIGILILCLNCFAMAAIYYKRDKIHFEIPRFGRRESEGNGKEDSIASDITSPPSVRQSSVSLSSQKEIKKPKMRSKSASDVREEILGEASGITSTISLLRESNLKKKKSNSSSSTLTRDNKDGDLKPGKSPKQYQHRRHKSENSIYSEVNGPAVPDVIYRRTPSVTFQNEGILIPKSLNKSSSSINSIRSTTSRSSLISTTSKASVRSSTSTKPLKKNASCQSLPTPEYQWGITQEMTLIPRNVQESNEDKAIIDKESKVAAMQKKNYPKVLPDVPYIIDMHSSTLPKLRPQINHRQSLTQREIEELDDLHAIYRKKRLSKCEISTDSCDVSSNIESFYGTGGGEAPASPTIIYGTPGSNDISVGRNRKSGEIDYNQASIYGQIPPYESYISRDVENVSQLSEKKYTPFSDSRAPRGPLASFGKTKQTGKETATNSLQRYKKLSQNSIEPLDMHENDKITAETTTSPISTYPTSDLETKSSLNDEQSAVRNKPSSSSIDQQDTYDIQEISGTIKRKKSSRSSGQHEPILKPLDKPLKSVLKQTSAYDKRKPTVSVSSSSASISLIPVSGNFNIHETEDQSCRGSLQRKSKTKLDDRS